MKKIICLIIILLLSGCSGLKPGYTVWDRDGLTFQYPESFKVSTDLDAAHFNDETNLVVVKQTISELVEDCGVDRDSEFIKGYTEALKDFQKVGISSNIKVVDNLACGSAGGNSYMEDYPIGDNKGVLLFKEITQTGGSIDTFFIQLLIVTDLDEVYTITFNFSAYPPVKKYIKELREKNDGWAEPGERIYNDLQDYFGERDPIEEDVLAGYLEGEKVFREIIKSVEIKASY